MGTHPKAPSMVEIDGKWASLPELLEKNPESILGKAVAQKFKNKLPYLFKVLAAAKPLSIQAHPDKNQAILGFERENRLGISPDASNRNYKDDNHKPECICALTPFWALNGFRRISELLSLMEKIGPKELKSDLDTFRKAQDSNGLKRFYGALMTMSPDRQKQIIADAAKNAKQFSKNDPAFKWMIRLYNAYPLDIGIFSPLILNLVCLEPGQAMFLPSGELHSYLDGVGIELMANSDNVLRGGLTPKHVDVPELLNVLNFEERQVDILAADQVNEYEYRYPARAEEFVLSVIDIKERAICKSATRRSIEILLCTEGAAVVEQVDGNDKILMNKGTSIIVPAAVNKYRIEGVATLYKASVPTG